MKNQLLALALLVGATPCSVALSFGLNFVTANTTDIFGVTTAAADFSAYGFTGMTSGDVQTAVLNAVISDYLAYPTVSIDPSSPLGAGLALNVYFYLTSSHSAPSNGDGEYYFINVGSDTGTNTFLGQACLACVRTAGGTIPGSVSNAAIVGSVLLDEIGGLAGLASTNAQRINLIAGTTSHELGHSVSLNHPAGTLSNPGASAYSIMASGSASGMPNGERILDRAFGYSEFAVLMGAIGTAPDGAAIPEPSGIVLLGAGLLCAVVVTRRHF